MATVIMPLPARDFDPTETAIPWRVLSERGHSVIFATPAGQPGQADGIMLTGEGLDPWSFLPGLSKVKLVGAMLGANRAAREAYAQMAASAAFLHPIPWSAVRAFDFDALILPGGHRARGMRDYLESALLQQLVVACFRARKPVGAICHGVVLAARSIDPETGRSVLYGRKTTALPWRFEQSAARIARLSRFWDPTYYRTYRERAGEAEGFASVEREVTRALRDPSDFLNVPPGEEFYGRKVSGLVRDSADDYSPSWVVQDETYVSARWPGDSHAFAAAVAGLLQ